MPPGGSSITQPGDEFYNTNVALAGKAPGEVLASRSFNYKLFGFPTPLKVVQLKYVTTDAMDRPSVGITSVVQPPVPANNKVLSFHSVYDSLNPEHSPSRAIQGNAQLGTAASTLETGALVPFLQQGFTVVVPDIEGQEATLSVGKVYGTNTLDSLRATLASPESGVNQDATIGLLGYSGGAIATNWAAQIVPTYAPDINSKLVGAATGGLIVTPYNNVRYIDGSDQWSSLMAMALVGLTRAYDFDVQPYLSDYGKDVFARLEHSSILEVYVLHRNMTWASLFKPEFSDPRSVPGLVEIFNKTNLGQAGNPTVPFFYGQGNGGEIDGTPAGGPGIGTGDGVMVTGDNRTLARQHCEAAVPVQFNEYFTGHTISFAQWFPTASLWMMDRFNGKPPRATVLRSPSATTSRRSPRCKPFPAP